MLRWIVITIVSSLLHSETTSDSICLWHGNIRIDRACEEDASSGHYLQTIDRGKDRPLTEGSLLDPADSVRSVGIPVQGKRAMHEQV